MGEGDMVCSAAFDRDDEFFATAGVSKRIKVSMANKHPSARFSMHRTLSKLRGRSHFLTTVTCHDQRQSEHT